MQIPVDVKSVLEAVQGVEQARNMPVSAVVLWDETAPEDLTERVKTLCNPCSPGAKVAFGAMTSAYALGTEADFAVLVAGGSASCGKVAGELRRSGTPVMVVAVSADFVAQKAVKAGAPIPSGDLLDGSDEDKLAESMGKWALAVASSKKLAIAQAFSFARRPLAEDSIKATSLQNAGIGAVMFIPGADMPLMTLNQIKMLLQIAAAYGQPMDLGRVKELAGVVAGGFAARTVARELVGLVPVGGWAVKGSVGYSATWAMGYAALNYFAGGGGLAGVGSIATSAADKAVQAALKAKKVVIKGKDTLVDSSAVKNVAAAAGTAVGAVKNAGNAVASTAKSAGSKVKSGVTGAGRAVKSVLTKPPKTASKGGKTAGMVPGAEGAGAGQAALNPAVNPAVNTEDSEA